MLLSKIVYYVSSVFIILQFIHIFWKALSFFGELCELQLIWSVIKSSVLRQLVKIINKFMHYMQIVVHISTFWENEKKKRERVCFSIKCEKYGIIVVWDENTRKKHVYYKRRSIYRLKYQQIQEKTFSVKIGEIFYYIVSFLFRTLKKSCQTYENLYFCNCLVFLTKF